ncbi:hypothetical protein [Streptomyces sp. NPDC001744]|uniref:hypothetical protein n=1 Tax=Streptomyces sp. NPDC001744 TaxID=3364606 RepID=UPI0036BFBEBB
MDDARTPQEPLPPEEPLACARCGTTADAPPLTWTCSVEDGRRVYFCEDCARAHLRAIEARLDSSWW